MGGGVYAVTSEPHTLAREARENWGLSFETIGDPHHEISDELRRRGWLHLVVNAEEFHGVGDGWRKHPKGFFQPGVIVIARNGRVLYRWRSVPNRQNVSGATHRAIPEHVWRETQKSLGLPADAPNAPLDDPPLDRQTPPWPLFVAILLANGNFIRPRPFPLLRDGTVPTKRFQTAPLKLIAFLIAWTLAFAWLPTPLVLLALAGWAAWITPKLRELHRVFQHVREEELTGETWT